MDVPESVVVVARVCKEALSVAEHEDGVAHAHMGAVVSFCGVVRDHDGGASVERLFYEGHPHAEQILKSIASDVAARYPAVRVAISHRIGDLVVGDVALVAAVASAHRAQAFSACAELVEDVKARLPIWKEQFFSDGTSEWVGSL
ncbi:molybdenum cofactor biosynthesis protein MoaE [Jonesia quinghaiensis]|uniref:molybdenum cofactor biosynthesis protein MoaE n=1 Tax=Jonesia quinghaiensis TaxID=262806 RepID=UPI0003F83067|nr:molybdenum cofactor biosynthesis protein MoaE [Jonesia quinghaiensis]